MTREHWRTKLRRRQNRRRQPPVKWARASMRGGKTASIAVAAPRGDAHIYTVVSHSNDLRNMPAPQRRGGGDTRRFPTVHRRACPFNGGLPAAVLPPAQLRKPMFARHSRRFPTQDRAPGRLEGPIFWRSRVRACLIYANWSIGVHAQHTRFRKFLS